MQQADRSALALHKILVRSAQEQYDQNYALGYRERDNDVECVMHTDLCDTLARVSSSYMKPITVLDLGCGTGRYFHCLRNTERIIGVDASLDMLIQSRNPVRASKIVATVELVRGDIFEVAFPNNSFDLIYCFGVLGDWGAVDRLLLEKVRAMLKNDGKFLFTVTDALSPSATSWKRNLARAARPFLPPQLKCKVDARIRPFRITEAKLRRILNQSSVSYYELWRRYSDTGRIDFVCLTSLK
jgi:SAM-dependent methyltransferase